MTPTTAIEVGGTRARISITAVVDTGFDGQLCLPMHLAVRLRLELMGAELVEFADGSKKQELYFRGWVRFLGERRRAKVFLTSAEDVLIGTDLFGSRRAWIDFGTGEVRWIKRPKRGKS